MKSTHWSAQDHPDGWTDDPETDPIAAADRFLEEDDDGSWDHRDDLIKNSKCEITLHGWIQTKNILDPEVAFDGYEPGQEYYAPTGETLVVIVTRSARVEPSDDQRKPSRREPGVFFNCPICLMPMSDYDGGCIRHDVHEVNRYIDRLRIAWEDIKRTVDPCKDGDGLFVKNRMNGWELHIFGSGLQCSNYQQRQEETPTCAGIDMMPTEDADQSGDGAP